MAKKDYSNWDKKELINEINQLRKHKKYGLVWEEKTENVVEQCKTELPVLEEVKDKEIITDLDKPVNLLIEGDNYHALSVLSYTHKGKIDVIYIDPPYNKGNKDFKYNDIFIDKDDAFRHSKWLSFMQKRLNLAKSLLKKTGVIFISIDDIEGSQLKLLCDEIFTEKCFVAKLPVIMNLKGNQDTYGFADTHEYCLVYTKYESACVFGHFSVDEEDIENAWNEDEYGYWKRADTLRRTGQDASRVKRPKGWFPVYIDRDDSVYVTDDDKPMSHEDYTLWPINDEGNELSWTWGKKKITNESYNLIVITKKDGAKNIYKKQRPQIGDLPTKKPKTVFYKPEYSTSTATNVLKEILGAKLFDGPKPVPFIYDLILLGCPSNNCLVLDFFAGSGTTGHAVLELNKKDNGNRKFVLCTNNENEIAETLTYQRISNVIKGYKSLKNKNISGLGGNLKYFKTSFVPADATDKNKIALTEKAGQMIAIKENTFEEIETNEWYQIFENKNKNKKTAIYFREDMSEFEKLVEKINGVKTVLYVFSYGRIDKKIFNYLSKDITIEDIPEPILEIYREINLTIKNH